MAKSICDACWSLLPALGKSFENSKVVDGCVSCGQPVYRESRNIHKKIMLPPGSTEFIEDGTFARGYSKRAINGTSMNYHQGNKSFCSTHDEEKLVFRRAAFRSKEKTILSRGGGGGNDAVQEDVSSTSIKIQRRC